MDESLYLDNLDLSNRDKVVNTFINNLLPTNRSYNFFVDWEKIRNKVNKHKYELNLLNSLVGSNDLQKDFKNLLKEYPEVVNAFPILIALRGDKIPVIEDFSEKNTNIEKYNFSREKGKSLSQEEIKEYYEFSKKTGIMDLFRIISDFRDYTMGVEVGMDTHARKNRSGKAMEILIRPFIEDLSEEMGFDLLIQRQLSSVEKEFDIEVPESYKNRKCDFILVHDNTFLNIEVNYYRGTGSKPEEIVNSYIDRNSKLEGSNGFFMWVTDGEDCWNSSVNQLEVAFNSLPYVFNIYLVRQGLLEKAISKWMKST